MFTPVSAAGTGPGSLSGPGDNAASTLTVSRLQARTANLVRSAATLCKRQGSAAIWCFAPRKISCVTGGIAAHHAGVSIHARFCCPRSGNRLIVVRLDTNSGPAVARNAGIWAAKRLGVRLVCFTDADCQPEVPSIPCS